MITRRYFSTALGLAVAGSALGRGPRTAWAATSTIEGLEPHLAKLERDSGGRLGVAVHDTMSGARAGYRAAERFPMCSTFKVLASAAVLARVDAGTDRLSTRIPIASGDVLAYAPVTKEHVGPDGMTLGELCAAAIAFSDNTAANLILRRLGGPSAVTAYAASLGDNLTRLDRTEPDLNEALPGDPRDATTPAAMAENLNVLLFGEALSTASRDQLTAWMKGNRTGDARLRAGLPQGWQVGDKTGSGERGSSNDIGALWPPNRKPVLVAVFLTGTSAPPAERNAAIAGVGRAVAAALLA